jgi:hypothetical protein
MKIGLMYNQLLGVSVRSINFFEVFMVDIAKKNLLDVISLNYDYNDVAQQAHTRRVHEKLQQYVQRKDYDIVTVFKRLFNAATSLLSRIGHGHIRQQPGELPLWLNNRNIVDLLEKEIAIIQDIPNIQPSAPLANKKPIKNLAKQIQSVLSKYLPTSNGKEIQKHVSFRNFIR